MRTCTPDRGFPLTFINTAGAKRTKIDHGSMDNYELTMTITTSSGAVRGSVLRHAIFGAIGNVQLPPGAEELQRDIAFDRILEQLIIRALKEMEQSGGLADLRRPPMNSSGNFPSVRALLLTLEGGMG